MNNFDKLNKSDLLGFDSDGHAMWHICLPDASDARANPKGVSKPVGDTKQEGLSIAVGTGKVPG